MRRREFITLMGGAAAWPLAARAQQPAMPVIGFLNGASADTYAQFVHAFRQGLGEAGYTEGQNVTIEYRWADGQYDRLPDLVADLVRRQVAVIAATSTPAALTARSASMTIPIVFTTAGDPVRLGLVTSLSRPGGNVTGATQLNMEVAPKRLELAHELVPTATDFAYLINPSNPIVAQTGAPNLHANLHATARTLGLTLHALNASSDRELELALVNVAQMRVGGLVLGAADAFFNSRSRRLGELTVRHKVPAIYQGRDFIAAGGLASYGGKCHRFLSPGRHLYWPHPQRREARRPPGSAVRQGRDVPHPQDREGAWHHGSAAAARPRRRADRVMRRREFTARYC
jgi:putative tryptophan/tyrosine transport system substrate-binding protein